MKQPPKSCLGVLGALCYFREWVGTSSLLGYGLATTCIHKRLSELIALGYAEKKPDPFKRKRVLYRVAPGVSLQASGEVSP